jgi:hypothetical protein
MIALQAYQDALGITERMLSCARAAQWDQLVLLEKERACALAAVQLADSDTGRDPALRARKRVILERMIACDEEISALTQDWMGELRQILDSVDTRNKLERTYGAS